ncbi:plant/F20D21-34 protein, partial [Haematococcus lacustris]
MSKTRSADRFAGYADTDAGVAGPVTVARLQVGLLGLARGLKSDLDQLATRADTSSTPGLHLVLQVRSVADLRTALTRLGSVTPGNLMAVEVLWTPQADDDSLTQQEVATQYPGLTPL